MKKASVIVSEHDSRRDNYKTSAYIKGYVLSLIFTLLAYALVTKHVIGSKWLLAGVVAALALSQFVTQITLFLHLGKETKPKFRLLVFCFMLLVILILVGGSLWIMYNLNYRQMPSQSQINNYLNSQDGGL